MTEQQISKLAAALVEFQNNFSALSTEDAQWVIQNTQEAIGLMVEAVQNRLKPQVLKLVSSKIIIPAIDKFIAKEKFIIDTSAKAKLKISYLGDNFQKWFLDKIEENIPETELSSRMLLKWLEDKEIIAGVGGEDVAETKLAHVYHLISQQPNGEAGPLPTNGYVIFYVRDKDGLLRPVRVRWLGDGWFVNAFSVGISGWRADCLVVSRNS